MQKQSKNWPGVQYPLKTEQSLTVTYPVWKKKGTEGGEKMCVHRVRKASGSNLGPLVCYARVNSCTPQLLLGQVRLWVCIIDAMG